MNKISKLLKTFHLLAQTGTDILSNGFVLEINQRLTSKNGKYWAILQEDGNFCVVNALV